MNIHSILEKSIQVQLTILKSCYESHQPLTIDDLSGLLRIDRRSVFNYCERLCSLPQNTIFKKDGSSYHFIGDNYDFHQLKLAILENSLNFQILKAVCLHSNLTLYEFAAHHGISESFLRRQLAQVNHFFSYYDLKLKTREGTIFFNGKETQIRYAIYLFLWEVYEGVEWPFLTLDFQKILTTVKQVFTNIALKRNKIKTMEWCFILAVNINRSKQGYAVPEHELPHFLDPMLAGLSEVTNDLKTIISIYNLPSSELNFILLWIQTRPQFYVDKNIMVHTSKVHKKNATPINELRDQFYHYMVSVGIKSNEITSKKKLLDATLYANGIHDYLFSPFSGKKREVTDFIERNYPYFYQNMVDLTQQMQKNKFPWLQLSTLIEAFLVIAPPTFFDKEIKVKLESDYPLSIELLYVKVLQEQLRLYLNVFFTNELLLNPDVIIRTTEAPTKIISYENEIPYITIRDDLSGSENKHLVQRIKEIMYGDNQK
ncbi:hypothetical protein B835_2328 [Enterococcus mundtii 3F]|uniref:helix-turn-helix domain-containing protein n=1 Tax=Enterococcus mundtii TaxID=53346 RepID=UPI0023028BC5|nr:helix-turn-helix domain-containing protein [Enterococcus mundtii]MDA9462383.1 hypothetical protein [Enterococcus mundtii 3F]